MDTLDFLHRVLPNEGVYVSIIINGDGIPRQKFHDTLEELADYLLACSNAGDNVYYAPSAFMDKSSRKQINTRATKAFFVDIDCGVGKPYPTPREGLTALGHFVVKVGLPRPTVVASGNGIHAYWILDEELPPEQWTPLAQALKRLVPIFCGVDANGKPNFDPAVPADSARVLRAPGTINTKAQKIVKLLLESPSVPVSVIEQALRKHEHINPVATTSLTSTAPVQSKLLNALAVTQDYAPALAHVIESKCQQIGWAVKNQNDVSEPMWYALLGVAAYCREPEKTAVEWSKDYSGFDQNEVVRKLAHWKNAAAGPATCTRFQNERPAGCKGCKFKDRIKSPAQLGSQFQEVAVTESAPDTVAHTIPLPKPFKRTPRGIAMTIDETDVEVCRFDLYPVSYGRDEILGYEVVRYKWNRPHVGWQELTLRQAYLVDGNREFAAAIADQGIVLQSKKQTENFQNMLRSYMEELRQLRTMTNLHASMGWKENFTQFLLGNTLLKKLPDGTIQYEKISLSGTSHPLSAVYEPKGSLDACIALTSLLESGKLHAHQFAFGLSLSAVLYEFTGMPGITVNLYGPTGAGKTLAQYYQQSLWGDPRKLHFNAKFTQNALFTKLGYYNHLPVTIDEATVISPKEIGDLLYWISQGRDKARLNRNAEEKDAKTWATVVTTSSNKSFGSLLIASNMEADAQQARLLDIKMDVHPLFAESTRIGERLYNLITSNYGFIGPKFIEHLLTLGPETVKTQINTHKAKFLDKYKVSFAGHERYWEWNVVLVDYALSEAEQLGLIKFDYTASIKFVLRQIGVLREAIKENSTDTFDVLAEYLNEHMSAAITVTHTGKNKGMLDYGRMPRDNVYIRYDLYRKDNAAPFENGTVYIDRIHFRKWLALKGMDYRAVTRAIEVANADATPPSKKIYMGKDTPLKLAQVYVFGVRLTHPRMIGILNDADNAVDDEKLVKLTVVK